MTLVVGARLARTGAPRHLLAGVALLCLLSACATASAPNRAAVAPQTAPATAEGPAARADAGRPDLQAEWERTVAAAKREGNVVVSASRIPSQREAYLKFSEAYPDITLHYTGQVFADFEQKARTERLAGQYLWDVFVSGIGLTVFKEHIPNGWFEPLKPALVMPEVADSTKWAGGLDAAFLDTEKTYVVGFANTVQNYVKVNRDFVPEAAFNSYEDLLKPEFAGKIVILDAKRPGAGSLQLAAIRNQLGDEGIRKLLVDQRPALSEDARQTTEWVVRGTYPIGIGVSEAFLKPFVDEGLGRNIKPVQQARIVPAGNGNGAVMLVNRGPHPNAARVFVNWLLSKEGQTAYTQHTGENSRRLDVPPGDPATLPDLNNLDRYINVQTEENITAFSEVIQLAQRLAP
jgi:iron(III) transport system substrate-binding protein